MKKTDNYGARVKIENIVEGRRLIITVPGLKSRISLKATLVKLMRIRCLLY